MVISKCRYIKWSNNRCNIHKLIHKNGFFFKVGRNIQHSYHVLLYCTYIYFCFFFSKNTFISFYLTMCSSTLLSLHNNLFFPMCIFGKLHFIVLRISTMQIADMHFPVWENITHMIFRLYVSFSFLIFFFVIFTCIVTNFEHDTKDNVYLD